MHICLLYHRCHETRQLSFEDVDALRGDKMVIPKHHGEEPRVRNVEVESVYLVLAASQAVNPIV